MQRRHGTNYNWYSSEWGSNWWHGSNRMNRRGCFRSPREQSYGQHYQNNEGCYKAHWNGSKRSTNQQLYNPEFNCNTHLRNKSEAWFSKEIANCAPSQCGSAISQNQPPLHEPLLERSNLKHTFPSIKQELENIPSHTESISPRHSRHKCVKTEVNPESLAASDKCVDHGMSSPLSLNIMKSDFIKTESNPEDVWKDSPLQKCSVVKSETISPKPLNKRSKTMKCTTKSRKQASNSEKQSAVKSKRLSPKSTNMKAKKKVTGRCTANARRQASNSRKKNVMKSSADEQMMVMEFPDTALRVSPSNQNEQYANEIGLDLDHPVLFTDDDSEQEECLKPSLKQVKRKKVQDAKHMLKAAKKMKLELENQNVDCLNYDADVVNADDMNNVHLDWSPAEELASQLELSLDITFNVVNLLDEENTIPFIARYRKEATGDMAVDKLRLVSECYDNLRVVQTKAKSMIQTVSKAKKMTPSLMMAFKNARSMEELEHLYAPFKTNKKSLAERARLLGLEPPAMDFLSNPWVPPVCWNKFVQPTKEGLSSLAEVEVGIQHIIADCIAKDYAVLKCVQEIFLSNKLAIECKMNRNFEKKVASEINSEEVHKFDHYYNFKRSVSSMQPHQVLAINRGENLKVLSVKVDIPTYLTNKFYDFTFKHICKNKTLCPVNEKLIHASIKDACDRFIEPLVCRRVRSELSKTAEKASVATFAANLRNLLLTAPVSGQIIAAIDPGFTNGCKLAVVAPNGEVLHTDTLYLHKHKYSHFETEKLVNAIMKYSCAAIGIGNGTGCRETEVIISELIKDCKFHPLSVVYSIINESGVSIYSVSDDAAVEFPDMDPNHRSAVSLARRILDPLSEYIKVDPKHLGIGMYQHDISHSLLKKALDGVIEDCVSFIGVDLNICSKTVLSKVAGLTIRKAEAILKWRKENGAFFNREQLKLVPGLGPKTFEQCAGFLRILWKTLENSQKTDTMSAKDKCATKIKIPKRKRKAADVVYSSNLLDSTCIHPESYSIAIRLISTAGCQLSELGSQEFIQIMKKFISEDKIQLLACEFNIGVPTMKLIADGLQKTLDYDIRSEFNKPLFKQGVCDINSLDSGMTLSGKVRNVTSFGVFVDVGVGRDGLIHTSKINPKLLLGNPLCVGDQVEVTVLEVNQKKQQISLSLKNVLKRSLTTLQ